MVTLREIVPDEYELLSAWECFDALGWSYDEVPYGAENITCCGQHVSSGGWIGTEHFHCKRCGKAMQDMTGILPAGKNSAGSVCSRDDFEPPESGKVWTPHDIWGYGRQALAESEDGHDVP